MNRGNPSPVLVPDLPAASLAPAPVPKQVEPAPPLPQLSAPQVPRRPVHTRQITATGYRRDDGLWEVEAQLSDVRSYAMNATVLGSPRAPGEPLHLMSLRIVLDDEMTIVDAEAVTHRAPYGDCDTIVSRYGQLVGLRIRPGLTQQVRVLFKGSQGCTHITDLFGTAATTALQTIRPMLTRWHLLAKGCEPHHGGKPPMLDSCHGLRRGGPAAVVRWGKVAE